MVQFWTILGTVCSIRAKRDFSEKTGSVTFSYLWTCNFMEKIRKKYLAFRENRGKTERKNGRTNLGEFIGTPEIQQSHNFMGTPINFLTSFVDSKSLFELSVNSNLLFSFFYRFQIAFWTFCEPRFIFDFFCGFQITFWTFRDPWFTFWLFLRISNHVLDIS